MNYEKLKNNRTVRYLYYFLYGNTHRASYLRKAKETLEAFGTDAGDKYEAVIRDMVRMKTLYGFGFDEYLLYKFHKKNLKERLEFVPDWEHLGYTCAMNSDKNAEIFDNKWITYEKYGDYYKRDVFTCENENSRDGFFGFLEGKETFIVKPLDLSCGRGVQKIYRNRFENDNEIWKKLIDSYGYYFIVEELIEQVPEMAKFHPSSLNTVRVPTIRLDNETLIVNPFMRIGQHGSIVDNAGAGGIICAVDAESGKLFAAADEKGATFEKHPESGVQIIGFEIPRWDEAVSFVKKLAQVIPENRYTGWDIALTEDGWKLVEANRRGQFVWQIPMQKGFRKEINGILRKLGRKY